MCAPWLRTSVPMTEPTDWMRAGVQVAMPMPVGNTVAPIAMCPWGASSAMNMGMPSRVWSITYFCSAFPAMAARRGFRPLSRVLRVQGSARYTAHSIPAWRVSMSRRKVSETSTRLGLLMEYISHPRGQRSCPAFSSTVMRLRRSVTRASVGRLGLR